MERFCTLKVKRKPLIGLCTSVQYLPIGFPSEPLLSGQFEHKNKKQGKGRWLQLQTII